MAKTDIFKFRELVLTDSEFQEKLRKATEAYTGEMDERSVFDNVLTPLAGEYGLSATYEEFREFAGAFSGGTDGELSEDELTQVAGGKGKGVYLCLGLGAGFGTTDNPCDSCMIIGAALGVCVAAGASA